MTKLVSSLLCSVLLVAALSGCKSYAANSVVVQPERAATLRVVNGGLQNEAQLLPDESQALYEGDILVGAVSVRNNVDGRVMYVPLEVVRQRHDRERSRRRARGLEVGVDQPARDRAGPGPGDDPRGHLGRALPALCHERGRIGHTSRINEDSLKGRQRAT